MPVELNARTPIDVLATSLSANLTELGHGFSYYAAAALGEDDLREFLHDPVAALPPLVCQAITPVRVVLVPFLSKGNGQSVPTATVTAPPVAKRLRSAYLLDRGATLFFAVQEENPADYHQVFFNTLAHLLSRRMGDVRERKFMSLVSEELAQEVNGEVGEASWRLKQSLPRTGPESKRTKQSRAFNDYLVQAFVDTATLYMHGICCDIDVEPGPRQMASRYLRKRLELLNDMFPPPVGHVVFPEQLRK